MMKLLVPTVLPALLLILFAVQSPASNIVVNGDFEESTDVADGDTLPSSWGLNSTDNVALSNCGVSSAVNPAIDLGPQSGTNFMTFQSHETDGSQDCLYQQLPTVVGQKYLITFSVAITSGTIGPDAYLDPEWDQGGTDDTFLRNSFYYPTSSTNGPAPYETFSFTETASKSSTTFYFHGVDTYGGSILLDNVSVSPVPEPSGWELLALACAGFIVRRAWTRRSFA